MSDATRLRELVDLAAERCGGVVMAATGEFFAPGERLLKPDAPAFIDGQYTERGKWMDGWETRRRRVAGHDWVVIRLGARGRIRRIEVDTSHFKGNAPGRCAVDGCDAADPGAEASTLEPLWSPVLAETPVQPHTRHHFETGGVCADP